MAFIPHSGRGSGVTLSFRGDKELLDTFLNLPKKVQTTIARKAVTKANDLIYGEVVRRTPRRDDDLLTSPRPAPHLADMIVKQAGPQKKNIIRRQVALPTREALNISPDDKYYWPAAVEYGHAGQ